MRLLVIALATVTLTAVTLTRVAQAQIPSDACRQRASTADYGAIRSGSSVVLQRHRFVGDDPHWDDRMGRFLGRTAHVTRLSGVDEAGCPGVRVDIDGGRWFWRVRDLGTGDAPIATATASDSCGQTNEPARYGSTDVDAEVVLGRHRSVDGDDNWRAEMSEYVGRSARVVERAGVDDRGCPGVLVDADGRRWFWRIRDLTVSGHALRVGLAEDHGRARGAEASTAPSGTSLPEACGQTDQTADFGPLVRGIEVVLGRHRDLDGVSNWVVETDPFVGRVARVIELVGVDDAGCPIVRVDRDRGEWLWRVRDLRLR